MFIEITDYVNSIRRDNYIDTEQIESIQKLPSKIQIFLKSGSLLYLEPGGWEKTDEELNRILQCWRSGE